MTSARLHRHAVSHPALWSAITAGLRDAAAAHPEIMIPERFEQSVVKRIAGNVLGIAPSVAEAARLAGGAARPSPAEGQEGEFPALLTANELARGDF